MAQNMATKESEVRQIIAIQPAGTKRGGFGLDDEYRDEIEQPHYDVRLIVEGSNNTSGWGIGEVRKGTMARQINQGQLIEGPWGFAFGLSTAITANPQMSTAADMARERAAGKLIEAKPGDLLELEGGEYLIVVDRRGYVHLVQTTRDMDLDDEVGYVASIAPFHTYHGGRRFPDGRKAGN